MIRIVVIALAFGLLVVGGFACTHKSQPQLTADDTAFVDGNGTKSYTYPSGAIKLEERYVDGKLIESVWFRPDGSTFAKTKWRDGTGVGYYLRDDGSVRSAMQYQNGLANGIATEFAEDGSVVSEKTFRNGVEVRN